MKKMVILLMVFLSLFPVVSFAGEAAQNLNARVTPLTTKEAKLTSNVTTNKNQARFPHTGEKKTIYLSIAGIAVILLILLLLFIRSKK